MDYQDEDWIHVVRDRVHTEALVSSVVNLLV
jgi:hypothetical protein